jgi:hypothetical protein
MVPTRTRSVLISLAAATLLAACDRGSSSSTEPASTVPPTGVPAPSPADGYVPPYSPAPTPIQEVQNGFVGEALTLPTTSGGKIFVTIESTAMTTVPVNTARSLSVWMTLENPGDEPWIGVPGGYMTITDERGGEFLAVPTPLESDLHPEPQAYGYSNEDLHKRVTIQPGESLDGVVVFRPTGGNRPIQIHMSLDKGKTFGFWVTNLGVF